MHRLFMIIGREKWIHSDLSYRVKARSQSILMNSITSSDFFILLWTSHWKFKPCLLLFKVDWDVWKKSWLNWRFLYPNAPFMRKLLGAFEKDIGRIMFKKWWKGTVRLYGTLKNFLLFLFYWLKFVEMTPHRGFYMRNMNRDRQR